jgi:hypothetical protein
MSDAEFLGALPPQLRDLGEQLLSEVRRRWPGNLHASPSKRFVEGPDNYWTVKIQPVDGSLRITVRGEPERLSADPRLGLKADQNSYSTFKIRSVDEIPLVLEVLRNARRKTPPHLFSSEDDAKNLPQATASRPTNECMACGQQPARWLVTWPYDQKSSAGRLLRYCDRCRDERRDVLWVAMPIAMLTINPEAVLLGLYECGLVATDPEVVAEQLGLPGPWVIAAQKFLQ